MKLNVTAGSPRVITLPPFDRNGVTQGNIPYSALNKLSGKGPLVQVVVKPERDRPCDIDGAPFSRYAIYVTGWETAQGSPMPPPAAYGMPFSIYQGVGSSVEEVFTGQFNTPAVNSFEDGVGLLVQIAGVLVQNFFISWSYPTAVPLIAQDVDIRPSFRVIVDRFGFPIGLDPGAIAVIKGALVT